MNLLKRPIKVIDNAATRHKQQGAAAIETALMLVIFFILFYAIVGYSIPIMLKQAFQHAAANGARAALAVDPDSFSSTTDYIDNGVKPRVKQVVASTLDWLPSTAKTAVLGTSNEKVGIDFSASDAMLTVTVIYTGYKSSPLIPVLVFPGIGDVPKLPDDIEGKAVVNL